MRQGTTDRKYIVTTALMGFGHLRAAHNIAGYSHAPLVRVDKEPYVRGRDKFVWTNTQRVHTYASRDAESKNSLLYNWFENLMRLPDDHRPPPLTESKLVLLMKNLGLGEKFFHSLGGEHPTLLHTFYLQAMISVYRRYPGKNFLLLCDTDFHRVWVPLNSGEQNLEYFVPAAGSADRLMSYGVPSDRIHITGFPLPVACTGTRDLSLLSANMEIRKKRLTRVSTVPLTVMFPFSGAGAYSHVLAELVKSLLDFIREGSVRLIVACGNNGHALQNAENLFLNYGLDESEFAEIMFDPDIFRAFDSFNSALKSVDVIVTKPGELIFYAALGIPIVFLPPIGGHEAKNREYLFENKCAVDMPAVSDFPRWLMDSRRNETLLEMAEMGKSNLPKTGTFEIDEIAGRHDDNRAQAGKLESQEA